MSGARSFLPDPTPEDMACLAHIDDWLAAEADLDLPRLAAHVAAGGDERGQIEGQLTEALEVAIFAAEKPAGAGKLPLEVRALHGLTSRPFPVAARFEGLTKRQLEAERDRVEREWHRALSAADYRAEKLEELEDAPDSVAAAAAVSRWNLFEERSRQPVSLPPAEAPGPLPTATKAELHASVAHHVADFFARADDQDARPPLLLLTAETGSRKTGITLAHLATKIAERKAAGLPYRAVLLTPSHKLSRGLLRRAREAGRKARIDAALFLGRSDGTCRNMEAVTTCRNMEAVTLANQIRADIRTTVCGSGGTSCAWRHGFCTEGDGYFAGLERARKADLVIAAHNFLFDALPRELRHDVAWVIVEEDFAALADRVFDLSLDTFSPESLDRFPVLDDDDAPDQEATAELQRLYEMIVAAARVCLEGDGFITAETLRSVGFTAMSDAPKRTRALSHRRKRPVEMRPGMDPDARKAAAKLAAINGQLGSIAALTYALDAILSGREGLVSVRLDMRRSGARTMLTVRGQRERAEWLKDLPVLMLNATGRIEDVRRVFDDAELAESPRAAWPHCEVHQLIGGFGQSTLKRHETRLAELRDFMTIATLGQKTGFAVTYKSCKGAFAGMPGLAVENHGNIAGVDEEALSLADFGFVIGGAFADWPDIASIAAARGGGAVQAREAQRVTRAALLTSGAAVEIEPMAYGDPAADAVHRGIYDASIVQAAGRLRPLERTASNPAVLYVCANVTLPFPATSVSRWRDVRPDRLVRMVAHGAVWLNADDAHAFEGDMFKSPKAAEHVRGCVTDAREAVRAIVRDDTRAWSQFFYQLRGQGRHLREVIAPVGAAAAIKAAVEEQHGELAKWQAVPFTPGREVLPKAGNIDIYAETGITSAPMPADLAEMVRTSAPIAADLAEYVRRGPPDG